MLSIEKILHNVNHLEFYNSFITDEDLEKSVTNIILSLVNNHDIYFGKENENTVYRNNARLKNFEELLKKIKSSKSILIFQTSGTTGTPKTVKKKITEIEKGIVLQKSQYPNVWGFCYSTRHISGLYVMLQAIYTESILVDLRNITGECLVQSITKNKVTNISAPTTFFKLNFPLKETVFSVKTITNGGEPLSNEVVESIIKSCPNAKVKNVYASTEFGSLLVSKNQIFTIPPKFKNTIKIIDDKIWVHKSHLSEFKGSDNEWYDTNDKVKMVDENGFEIIGRITEDVKVLGHLVSIRKIEEIISTCSQVKMVRIKTKNHKVFGTLLTCEIVPNTSKDVFNKDEFKTFMKDHLRDYERPQKIELVSKIEITYSGKLKR